MLVYDDINKEDLSARADTIKDYQEAMKVVIKEWENIIKTNKKKIIGFAYKQSKICKIFEQFRTSSTIIFKISIVKLVDKDKKCWHHQLRYFKDIKGISKECLFW